MRIGLDVSGGDFAPKANLDGAILAQRELPDYVKIFLIAVFQAAIGENG
jgi:glycerol-3-phosphate acyltransferase PlsX